MIEIWLSSWAFLKGLTMFVSQLCKILRFHVDQKGVLKNRPVMSLPGNNLRWSIVKSIKYIDDIKEHHFPLLFVHFYFPFLCYHNVHVSVVRRWKKKDHHCVVKKHITVVGVNKISYWNCFLLMMEPLPGFLTIAKNLLREMKLKIHMVQ